MTNLEFKPHPQGHSKTHEILCYKCLANNKGGSQ
jgi:hypothetical protein